MKFIKRMPWTISGLILGLFALGNLLASHSGNIRTVFGIVAGVLFILYTIKILSDRKGFKEFVSNPLFLGVFTTYPMALNLLSAYLKPYMAGFAQFLWYVSALGIIVIMIQYAVKFLSKKDLSKIFASTYIVYSGIAVAAITAPAFDLANLGRIFAYIALIGYIVMTPFVFKRIFYDKSIPEPARETNAIMTAPLALTIAGYNSSMGGEQNMTLLLIMLVVSQIIYFYVLTKAHLIFKPQFKPSFAGFTFPIVISAIALKTTNGFLVNAGKSIAFLKGLVIFEEIVATVIMLYLFYRFMKVSFSKEG